MKKKIALATSSEEITRCYAVMAELRPHISAKDFLPLVEKLAKLNNFKIAYLEDGEIKSVAGIRIGEWLAASGKYLEIEDLVTKSGEQSKGYGGELFDWLVAYAVENDCTHLRLVSNVARVDAHRFYERKGMKRLAHYFSMNLVCSF